MNDMNQWEKQLESWTPRPPSPGLEHRLFPAAPDRISRRPDPSPAWFRLVPAACLFLLAAVYFLTPRDGRLSQSAAPGSNMMASLTLLQFAASAGTSNDATLLPSIARTMAASNLLADLARPYLEAQLEQHRADENLCSLITFQWTRTGALPSTTRSFRPARTNTLKL